MAIDSAELSVEATKQTMDAYLDALLNGGDYGQFFSEDVRWTTIESGEQIVGREAVGDFIGSMHTTLFDAHPVLKNLVVGAGIVFGEFDFVGTNTGDFEGVAATGQQLTLPYVVVYDVDERGITELRAYLPIKKIMAVFRAT